MLGILLVITSTLVASIFILGWMDSGYKPHIRAERAEHQHEPMTPSRLTHEDIRQIAIEARREVDLCDVTIPLTENKAVAPPPQEVAPPSQELVEYEVCSPDRGTIRRYWA